MESEQVETELGSWTVNFRPSDGGRYTGSLVITDQRVMFVAKYDTSSIASTVAKVAGLGAVSTVAAASYGVHATEAGEVTISIPRTHIRSVCQVGSALSKSVQIQTTDDRDFVFHYGALSVKKILAALESAQR